MPVVLAVGFGLYNAANATPKYRASVTFFVATTSGNDAQTAVQGDEFAQRRVNSYLALVKSDRLANKVIAESGVRLSVAHVKGMMGANSDLDTVVLTATVTGKSEAVVSRVADAVSTEFPKLVDEVENERPGTGSVHLEVVSGPNVSQIAPHKKVGIALWGFVGLLIGLAIAWLLELRDKTIRSEAQLTQLHPVPILGMIPFDRLLLNAPRARELPASSPGVEAFRQLRTNLEFINMDTRAQIVVVTSSVASEGKTTVATNLAAAMVVANRRVLLIEADLRRPTLDEYFRVHGGVGLTDVLVGHAEVEDAMQPVGFNSLMLLPSGQLPPNPSELLGSNAMVDLLQRLRYQFDSIVINTPPLLPVTDAAVLSAHADGVVVVVRAAKTTRHQLMLAMRSLQAVGARVLGTVFNMSPAHKGSSYEAYWQRGTGTATSAQPAMPASSPRSESSEAFPATVATVGPDAQRLRDEAELEAPSAAAEDATPSRPRDPAEVHDEGVHPVSSASSSFPPWKDRPDR